MDEKTVNKYLRRSFSPMGWTLVGYYFVMTLLVLLSMLRGELQAELGQLLGMWVFPVYLMLFFALTLLAMLWLRQVLRREGKLA